MCITCNNCLNPNCKKCGQTIDNYLYQNNEVCKKCRDKQKKKKFSEKWKNSSPSEKLNLYGTKKLKILAKRKGVKKYYKMTKLELITALSPMVGKSDFPI